MERQSTCEYGRRITFQEASGAWVHAETGLPEDDHSGHEWGRLRKWLHFWDVREVLAGYLSLAVLNAVVGTVATWADGVSWAWIGLSFLWPLAIIGPYVFGILLFGVLTAPFWIFEDYLEPWWTNRRRRR